VRILIEHINITTNQKFRSWIDMTSQSIRSNKIKLKKVIEIRLYWKLILTIIQLEWIKYIDHNRFNMNFINLNIIININRI